MSEVMHLAWLEDNAWCEADGFGKRTNDIVRATCLACLLACAEYGSEARHRYEVLREQGVKP